MMTGERLARSIAAGDRQAVTELLAPHVKFRAVTPSRFWEADSAAEAVNVMLGTWFGPGRTIDAVESVESASVADCDRAGYRFRASTPEGPTTVEQQAYLTVKDGAITSMRVVCSGFRPS